MDKRFAICALSLAACVTAVSAADYKATEGDWTLEIPESSKMLNISYKGTTLFNQAYAMATYNHVGVDDETTISTLSPAEMPQVTVENVSDCFGEGKSYVVSMTADGVTLKQSLSFYPALPYMIAQVKVVSNDDRQIQSRSLTALAINAVSTPLNGASNRMVWVPFDNDGHLKYIIRKFTDNYSITSHEVGYVFDGDSRRGLIAGSVDHDTWKSGITLAGTLGYKLEQFKCESGFTNYYTRDTLPHGKVSGSTVASARYFVGLYEDWREGLNDFGDANTKVVPKAVWTGGNPIGWSSWGVQQNYITYTGVEESARFIKENLYDLGFHNNDGKSVISLDSFATDNISSANLYKLGTKVFGEGTYRDGLTTKTGTNMILGQYCGPMVAWGWVLDSKIQGTGLNGTPDYTWRDAALKVNGDVYKVTSNSGYAVDPTHPAIKSHIEFFMKQFAANGAKYVKADFLNNGIIEGDSWYDPTITTGVQAYNYGMKLLHDEAEKYGMYLVESIAPIFPYQYGHGRRTCCDRFSEIAETEYVMNSISYGWWTDRLYTVNDPDQLVMCKGGNNASETLGENRARATSGMAAGAFIFGDNFSDNVFYTDSNGHTQGDVVGYPEESRNRAPSIMGNADINQYVRDNTGSFMPVEGHKPSESQSAESLFMRRTGNQVYLIVFNYNKVFSTSGTVTLERLGITDDEIANITEIKELWSGDIVTPTDNAIEYTVPAKDVKVFRITFGGDNSGVTDAMVADNCFSVARTAVKQFSIICSSHIAGIAVYDIMGRKMTSAVLTDNVLDLSAVPDGVCLLQVSCRDNTTHTAKLYNH